MSTFNVALSFFTLTANVLQLQEVGDFEAQNCLPALNLLRRIKLYLSTEPPISCRCCYGLVISVLFLKSSQNLFQSIFFQSHILNKLRNCLANKT